MRSLGLAVERTASKTAPIDEALPIHGGWLTISEIARVAAGAPVALSRDPEIGEALASSREAVDRAVAERRAIYGVTTSFGGMADRAVEAEVAAELQNTLVWSHKAGAGNRLPSEDVRAGMLLRANSLAVGISGIRAEILERFETFLNAGATPHVYEFGSIGASGDQVPLAYIAGTMIGLDPHYMAEFEGEAIDSVSLLGRLGLKPVPLIAKEGLALINGTSVTAGIAANCVDRARRAVAIAMGVHALFVEALAGSTQPFEPFIHEHKPHAGQLWAASWMRRLLSDSRLARMGSVEHRAGRLIQDRYSIRCLPQFLGPIVDGLATIALQVETEASSVTDNPLIEAATGTFYHCGNFLAQYIGVAMDQLRYHLGMLVKHLDVQVALLVSPEFNNGLPPSLVGNPDRSTNTGLKALQLTGNSIMPQISFYGNSIADRFPTHAEQFNQNLNSQGYGSATLARRSLELVEQYLAVALLFAVQAVDLRTYADHGHFDARQTVSPLSAPLYQAVRTLTGRAPSKERPLIRDDREQFLDLTVAAVAGGISARGAIADAVSEITDSLERHS